MKYVTELTVADFISILNGLSGFTAIYLFTKGDIKASLFFILVSVLLDFLDGRVARLTKKSSKYGKDLDSLSDVISFGVVPAIQITAFSVISPSALLIGMFWLFSGIARLARFNNLNIKDYFLGTPITLSACVVTLAHLLTNNFTILAFLYIIFSIAMISDLKIRKI